MKRFRAETLQARDSRMNEGLLWVGGRPYPALVEAWTISDPWFATRRARVHTETPVTLSVVWGSCTYSDNHHSETVDDFQEEPEKVEVGILHKGELVGEPLGWQSTDQVLALIGQAQCGLMPEPEEYA